MPVMTVTGPVSGEALGVTLMHEHLLFDADWIYQPSPLPSRRAIAERPLSLEVLGWARKYSYESRDNCHRLDPEEAMREIRFFKWAGGQTVVDQTCRGIGRDPRALLAIARETGLNVVMGCGYYIQKTHPAALAQRSVEDIADELVAEISVGVGNTGIRPGIIGEIGTDDPVAPGEEKVLRAAARAQSATGLPLSVHQAPWAHHAQWIVDVVREEGADLRRTVVCHCDLDVGTGLDEHIAIASTGAYLGFDTFGHYERHAYGNRATPGRICATDWDRAQRIVDLAEAGYLDHIVLSQDLCLKTDLKTYGGFGFDHLLESGVPILRMLGLSEHQIRRVLIDNPCRVLTGDQ